MLISMSADFLTCSDIIIAVRFATLVMRPLRLAQELIKVKVASASCIALLSVALDDRTVTSSAQAVTSSGVRLCSKSLMYSRKSVSASTELFGTSEDSCRKSDNTPQNLVDCLRSVRYDLNHAKVLVSKI